MFSNIFEKFVIIILIFLGCHFLDVRGKSITEFDLKNETDLMLSESNNSESSNQSDTVEEATTDTKDGFAPGDCRDNPCKNGGECKIDINDKVKCICTEDYLGEFCEENMDDVCNVKLPKCVDTGGKCNGDVDELLCQCKEFFIRYEKDEGCISSVGVCYNFVSGCVETGGICISDKIGRLHCRCPEGAVYEKELGCRVSDRICALQQYYCTETGGICVLSETKETQCKCPQNSEYVTRIGCQVPKNICSKHQPFCEESCGSCVLDKNGVVQCRCPNGKKYNNETGCQDACPCRNGGICQLDQGVVKCFCKEPYGGKFCDNRMDSNNNVLYIAIIATLSCLLLLSCICVVCQRVVLIRTQ